MTNATPVSHKRLIEDTASYCGMPSAVHNLRQPEPMRKKTIVVRDAVHFFSSSMRPDNQQESRKAFEKRVKQC